MYEMEEMGSYPQFLQPLEEGITAVYDAMCRGEYAFGREDLSFMDVANVHADNIPFHILLKQINENPPSGTWMSREIT